ncbi:glycogen/starch synthase [Acetobacter estunensis NRIC 0472]|uniref:Glycogen synthase n=1 Tax=Acetobacter estunensis TaxID=104097 RepID=A0A967B3W6_9PROT|nr:glycogen synthase GlgA [Acetobacter estunensis]NHO53277.1 glycogen synthase GlgA [Acetobacter estunensis]GBQ23609.1 glycogen/starch synthase [Acetobacter estunensis NRIC 0472]
MAPAALTLSRPLHLLSVASEMFPFVKTGGLGDVTASLPSALTPYDVQTRTLLPGYPAVLAAMEKVAYRSVEFGLVLGHAAQLKIGQVGGQELLVLDIPALYDRPGNPYVTPEGCDWPDNGLRFAALARAAATIGQGGLENYHPDIVQLHDWQAGLTAAYLHYDGESPLHANGMSRRPRIVQTIHNLAFHGSFPPTDLPILELPPQAAFIDGCEFHGRISFLKAGLFFSDWITTVSPTYAQEIQGREWGMGFDGLLRTRTSDLTGILNGVDINVWNPAHDPAVRFPYVVGDTIGRLSNKLALQAEFGLPQDRNAFLIGIVSRLTRQKGVDLLPEIMERLLVSNTQVIVVGEGDRPLHRAFSALQRRFPRSFACHIGYSEELGHRLPSAVDALLVPSRFEPCGLTQLCALRYGAVPIVSRVGGLADTVVDANDAAIERGVGTGFLFSPIDGATLAVTVERARRLFRENRKAWSQLQKNGAATDVSWHEKSIQYSRLFAKLAEVEIVEPKEPNVVRLSSAHASDNVRGHAFSGKRHIARKPPIPPSTHRNSA